MDSIINIDNLCFKYNNNILFNNFCLSIKRGSFTTILGNNGSGKSTLVRLLLGLIDSNNSIVFDNVLLCGNTIFDIRKNIGVVFDNPDNCLISETVMDDLAFSLENLNFSRSYILSRINDISNYLGISHLLNCNPKQLSGGEKQLVCLACALMTGPKVMILDEAMCMLDDFSKENIFNILSRINNDYGVTILNITHDIEDSIYGTDIVLLDNGKLILNCDKLSFYKQEKLLKNYGFGLPFMIDLSNKLSYYDLIDDFVFDMEGLIDILWK